MYYYPGITGVFNDRGTGKTTYVVKYGISEKLSRRHYSAVYANIHIGPKIDEDGLHYGAGIPCVDFDQVAEWHFPSPKGIPRVLLLLDQGHKYLYSREAMTKRNRRVIKVLIESRQHGFDVIYDTWARHSIDPAIRPFTNLVIEAHAIRNSRKELLGFRYDRMDKDIGVLPSQTLSLKQALPIFKCFDSNEIVPDYEIKKKEEGPPRAQST